MLSPSPFVPRILLPKMRGVLQGPRAIRGALLGGAFHEPKDVFSRALFPNTRGALVSEGVLHVSVMEVAFCRAGGGRDKQSRVISDSDIATPFFSYLTNPDMFYWCSQRHFTDALPPLRFGSFALPCIRRQLRFLIDAILLMKVTEPGCDSGHRRRQYGCGKMHEGRARESICWNLRGQDNDI